MVFKRSLTLKNDVQEVDQIVPVVQAACEAVGFDELTTVQMNLAVEECVVNVVDYAYPEDTQGDIMVDVEANEGCLSFSVSDQGVAFDPTKKGDVDTPLPAEERQIGGLGIFLIKSIMDDVSYERSEGRNVLTMKKYYKPIKV